MGRTGQMKVIIRNENGTEEVFYEPHPIQEEPSNKSTIGCIIEDIILFPIMLILIILIGGISILMFGAFIFAFLYFILKDTTMEIISFIIIVLLGFLYVFNYSSSVVFMLIDKKTQRIIIDYEFMNTKKNKREVLEFSNIKDIKIHDVVDDYGVIVKDKYGNTLTNITLIKEEKDRPGYNECVYLYINAPREKGVELAKAIGIDSRPIDTTLQMKEV